MVGAASSTLGPGVLAAAFIPPGTNNLWHILFDDPQWVWDDGPGNPIPGAIDLQGVGCHEFGHALGMGHTTVMNATMFPSVNNAGVSERSIEGDDRAGIQAAYGVAGTGKPRITMVMGGTTVGSMLTITGTNFAATGNSVWFTPGAPSNAPVIVSGVASSMGGTQIQLPIPTGAGAGEIHVVNGTGGGETLSNSWPFVFGAAGCTPNASGVPKICSITPTTFLNFSQAPQSMVIDGYGFNSGALSMTIGSANLSVFTGQFTVVSDQQIRLDLPPLSECGTLGVQINGPLGPSNTEDIIVTAENTPWLDGEPTTQAGSQYTLFIGGNQGAIMLPFVSVLSSPTNLSPWVVLDIGGNNFTFLVPLSPVVLDACGTAQFQFDPGSPGRTGFFFWQTVELPPNLMPLPFRKSNVHAVQKTF